MKTASLICGAALRVALVLTPATTAHAVAITVTTIEDELNDDEDCSLREAIQAANTDTAIDACPAGDGTDEIVVPAGTYTLAIEGRAEDRNAAGDLDVTSDLTIRGAGAAATVIRACAPTPPESVCAGIDRVVHVDPSAAGITAVISGVTIENGQTVLIAFVNSAGGAILLGVANTLGDTVPAGTLRLSDSIVRNSSTPRDGGGIANRGGTLIVDHCTVSGNSAENGGAIHNYFVGEVLVDASTLRSNAAGDGGGLWNIGPRVTVRNSTVSGNSGRGLTVIRGSLALTNSTVSGNQGSGLFLFNDNFGGPHLVNNATIVDNTGHGIELASGGLGAGPVTLSNTIAVGNAGFDCTGTLMSAGHNLIQKTTLPFSNPSCSLVGDLTGNLIGTGARLGLLADNGGPTKTHALLAGNPAIDGGSPALPGSGNGACEATDQRGVTRPLGGACDMGAFESQREFSVSGMLPSAAGSSATTLALIYGNGFVDGATVVLTKDGEADIVGDPVTVHEGGAVIATTFDLVGKRPGTWDLVVVLPNDQSATRIGALTLTDADATQLWIDVLAPPAIRTGRATKFRLLVGNRGEVDAFAVPLVLTLPADYGWSLKFPIAPPPPQPGQVATDWSQVPIDATPEMPGRRVLFFLLPVVPAGFTGSFDLTLTAPQDGEYFVAYQIGQPYFRHGLDTGIVDQFTAIARDYARESLHVDVPEDRLAGVKAYVTTQLESLVTRGQQAWLDSQGTSPEIDSIAHLLIDAAQFAATSSASRAGGFDSPAGQAAAGLPNADCSQIQRQGGVLLAGQFGHGTGDCRDDGKKKPKRGPAGRSHDPNDKFGADGATESRYISGAEPLRYAIAFENLETATFPAQEVVVTDQLDRASMDLSTFSLGPIGFGDRQVVPPPGLRGFTAEVDLRPTQPFAVRIDVALDADTAVATWRFRTIDPTTGEPPDDARLGFLSPNTTSPEGEGSVVFTVKPKSELATGTAITNRASIVFDDNEAIVTQTWRNTIDNDKPASSVMALHPTAGSASFPVQWAGMDNGSGVADYTIYVSEDGAAPAVWLFETSDTSATFIGQVGRRYAFFSVARDRTGNLEDVPAVADTSTRVILCSGDCDTNSAVTVDELVIGVTIALGTASIDRCTAFDLDDSQSVTVDELVQAVGRALNGCG